MDDFLSLERRCEYDISSKRKLLWKYELDMIEWLEDICKKNNLDYFFIGGSELGVIRHQGFIPWDDDIDIGMLREDFDRFLAIVKDATEYDIQYGLNKSAKYYDKICRIRDCRTTGIVYDQVGIQCNQGVFIEIYPYDFVPENKEQQKKHAQKVDFIQNVLSSKLGHNNGKKWKLIATAFLLVPVNFFVDLLEKEYRRYTSTNLVSTVTLPQYYLSGSEVLPYDYVSSTRYEKFEYLQVRVPVEAEKCLEIEYGEYMTLPPVEERGKHHNSLVFYDVKNPYSIYEGKSVSELYEEYGNLLND